eukprot:gnl/MRDRNA2_/MRDRNA2_193169_c0_seq1.p1 gnl/MRDRNA2_/MRDRNA2_193169_c0~~gnl/MRDRNA2_/MRDRNA2_193169_c0_seq1.p1  ORF type:complete len:126 (-),score=28.19 gnl/MRDRNA2_/MRDRNA2_193169_c0_seq1:34-411(-)
MTCRWLIATGLLCLTAKASPPQWSRSLLNDRKDRQPFAQVHPMAQVAALKDEKATVQEIMSGGMADHVQEIHNILRKGYPGHGKCGAPCGHNSDCKRCSNFCQLEPHGSKCTKWEEIPAKDVVLV